MRCVVIVKATEDSEAGVMPSERELRSPSDSLDDLQAKTKEYLGNGARLGWLIDPTEDRVFIYRPDREPEVLEEPLELAASPELPGFVLDLRRILWRTRLSLPAGGGAEDGNRGLLPSFALSAIL